ncbi:chemotaxis protein CheW [Pseudoduganella sp. RAF53_2]|uniref:chemotaxis protein CheW n=1 Tax=unclassified Pseudoduganella TaxID=2637179 RepID=UPI003F99FE66
MASTDQDLQPAAEGERRNRLRQYQAALLERMAARSGESSAGRELGVQVGDRRCLLDLTQVGEIVPWQAVTSVPLARDWYLGLANIRGNLTGVIDLARYMGGQPTALASDSRVVTFASGMGFNCALLVARVLGLRQLSEMEPQAEAEGPDWCSQQFHDRDAQAWTRLDLTQLVREARFLQVGL